MHRYAAITGIRRRHMPAGMNEPRPLVQTTSGFTSDNGVLAFLLRLPTVQEQAEPGSSVDRDPFRYHAIGAPLAAGQQVKSDCSSNRPAWPAP